MKIAKELEHCGAGEMETYISPVSEVQCWGDLIADFSYLMGGYRVGRASLLRDAQQKD